MKKLFMSISIAPKKSKHLIIEIVADNQLYATQSGHIRNLRTENSVEKQSRSLKSLRQLTVLNVIFSEFLIF